MRLRAAALVVLLAACSGSPTEPRTSALANGVWSGGGACLRVVSDPNVLPHTSTFTFGCGRGEFPTPDLRRDGTFDADGTFVIEVGPVSQNPPPPAHFSGRLQGATLTLTVTPQTLAPATYTLHYTPAAAQCAVPCV